MPRYSCGAFRELIRWLPSQSYGFYKSRVGFLRPSKSNFRQAGEVAGQTGTEGIVVVLHLRLNRLCSVSDRWVELSSPLV